MQKILVEKIDIANDNFKKLKEAMHISDRYEKTLVKLSGDGKAVLFGAKIDGRYVGRVTLRYDWTDSSPTSGASVVIEDIFPGLPQVNALEVDENYRKRGIASVLMVALEEEAVRLGFDKVGLGVEVSNDPAKKLYEKLGYNYENIGDSDTYEIWFGDQDPKRYTCRLMVKALQPRGGSDE